MLHSVIQHCLFPSCVGQAAKSWVCSPLGFHILLGLLRGNTATEKYVQIKKQLQNKEECNIISKLLYSKSLKSNRKITYIDQLDKTQVDFANNEEVLSSIKNWANPYIKELIIRRHIPATTTFALFNIIDFQCAWQIDPVKGASMKVHNSFSYTQDINYEARAVELPMQDEDLKLIILVPNQADLLHTLFRRLINEGLTAAFGSIQPLFTVSSVMRSPRIHVSSETEMQLSEDHSNEFSNEMALQYGTITVDEKGTSVKILSCLYSAESKRSSPTEQIREDKPPYFFAVVLKDTPIFVGQFYPKNS